MENAVYNKALAALKMQFGMPRVTAGRFFLRTRFVAIARHMCIASFCTRP